MLQIEHQERSWKRGRVGIGTIPHMRVRAQILMAEGV